MKRPARAPSQLSESLHQRQCLCACCEFNGNGELALVQAAEASIVYTPAQVNNWGGGVFTYHLDLNHDGVTDFLACLSATQQLGQFARIHVVTFAAIL